MTQASGHFISDTYGSRWMEENSLLGVPHFSKMPRIYAFHSFPCGLPSGVGSMQEKLHSHTTYSHISALAAHEFVWISPSSFPTVSAFHGPTYPHYHTISDCWLAHLSRS